MTIPTFTCRVGRSVRPRPSAGQLLLALGIFAGGTALWARRAVAQGSTEPPPSSLKTMTLEQLMDIEVTSVSKSPEKQFDAPAAIDVITQDDIRRSGAAVLPDALRLADNLEVEQKTSATWGVTARGFNTDLSNKLLVLVDGRSVYTPLFSGVFWDVQNYLLNDIDRVEVISGPGGTLWGANAVNGVINVTTQSAKTTQGLYVEDGGGTDWRDLAGARYGGTLAPNVYYRVDGTYLDAGGEVFTGGNPAPDEWKQGHGGFRIDAEPAQGTTFTLEGDAYNGTENQTTGGTDHVNGTNVLGRWSREYSADSHMSLQMYFDRTYFDQPVAALVKAPAGTFSDGLDTYDIDFQDHLRLGARNAVAWGLGYRFTDDNAGNTPGLTFLPAHLDQNLYSTFAQDEITLRQHLFFTLGTKLEHNDYTGFEWEPSGRIQWNVTSNQMVWAAISRAIRAPSRIDHDLSEPAASTGFVVLEGGSDFTAETELADEIGYRTRLGSRATASISTFYNDYNDVRSSTPSPTPTIPGLPFPLIFQNNLRAQTYGFELTANYQLLSWWRLHGGYNLLRENVWVKPGEVDYNKGLNETADPEQQYTLRSSMDLPASLELDAALRWVDTLHNNNASVAGTVPSYDDLDLRLGWRATKSLELSLVGQNLLQAHHPEYGFPSATREEIERTVYVKAAYRW